MNSAPRALLLFAIAAVSGWFTNRLRAEPISLRRYEAPTQCSEAATTPTSSVMSAGAVSSLCGRDDVLFADARDEAQFEQGHWAEAERLARRAGR